VVIMANEVVPQQFSYVLPTRKIARYHAIPLDARFIAITKIRDQDQWVPLKVPYNKEERAVLPPDRIFGQKHLYLQLKRILNNIGME